MVMVMMMVIVMVMVVMLMMMVMMVTTTVVMIVMVMAKVVMIMTRTTMAIVVLVGVDDDQDGEHEDTAAVVVVDDAADDDGDDELPAPSCSSNIPLTSVRGASTLPQGLKSISRFLSAPKVIITKLDGHAKGGGALSAVSATPGPKRSEALKLLAAEALSPRAMGPACKRMLTD